MFDELIGESEWSTDFPDMLYKDTAQPAQLQAFVSDESMDSLLGSWLEEGQIAGWVRGDELPAVNLTCSLVDILLPGISSVYGADSIVDIYFDTKSLSGFTTSATDQDVTVNGDVVLQFWPRFNGTTELAVELDAQNIKFIGDI